MTMNQYRPSTALVFSALAAAVLLLAAPAMAGSNSNNNIINNKGIGLAYAQSALTIKLDKSAYKFGEFVTVTGKTPTADILLIQVYNSQNEPFRLDQIVPGAGGDYEYSFKVAGKLAVNGEFTVKVGNPNGSVETKFTLTGGKEPAAKPAATTGMFKATAKADKKDTKITIASDKKAKKNVNKVVFELDKEIAKSAKVKAPSGWKVDAKGKTVTFTTDKKAIKPGKKATFTVPVVIKSATWSALDGSTLLEKGTVTAGKK
ncbi:hypothetical protein [Nitrososphaera sp.]|uniref:hypothetical protein n=1 Tax=Nitrososphaera sp. TaxID=1971748 RepID=UPI00307ED2F7